MKKGMDFLKDFNKEVETMDGVGTSSAPPRYWYSTGNFVLNKIISGSFYKGIPQGRITNFSGPSGSGKSFLAANVIREAQKEGAFIMVVDTENALDDDFMRKIGVDVSNNYKYVGVTTINQAVTVISQFLKGYKEEYNNTSDAPQVVVLLDSMDMMLTETELEHYDKGVQKGDQGQKNKQLKLMLRTFAQDIKTLNVAMIVTSQVYKNQDLLSGDGLWIIGEAVRYSASQIVLLTKMKLKDTGSSIVKGIRMKCEGYKTRFSKPYQTVVIEVPYDIGMDPYSGLVETLVGMGIVEKAGSRYRIKGSDDTWYEKDVATIADKILLAGEAQANAYLIARITQGEDDATDLSAPLVSRKTKS